VVVGVSVAGPYTNTASATINNLYLIKKHYEIKLNQQKRKDMSCCCAMVTSIISLKIGLLL
jgi:hypothetical protein